jgi:hypothetical protein
MLFQVERTSRRLDDGKPCPEAREDTIERWDRRTFKSPEEHDERFPHQPWYSKGTDHQIVYGPRGGAQGIKRRMEDARAWYVEIGSLEALMTFRAKHGEVILKTSDEDERTPTLEIYDDYRE